MTTTLTSKPPPTLFEFQQHPSDKLLDKIREGRSCLLIAPAGTGKTYAIASAIARAQQEGLIQNPDKMVNGLLLTPQSVRMQTARVLQQYGCQSFHVDSYSTLRSTLGQVFIDWQKGLEKGNLVETPTWRPEDKPELIVADECQNLKNSLAQQSEVVIAATKVKIPIIFASATPFTTIEEAKVVCLGLGVATEITWKEFSWAFCVAGKSPEDLSPKGVKNLTDFLEARGHIIRFENIKFAHRSINKCILIDFLNDAERAYHQQAYDDYLERLSKVDREAPGGMAEIWQTILQFRIRCEHIKAPRMSTRGYEVLKETGRQIIIASNFVETLVKARDNLVKVHGVNPAKISFIVGGQTAQDRQQNIDRFQSGKADFCFFTLKSGGVGVSLHHYKEGVGRPRHVILPPTWSAIELVQALGRAHRINSISTTHQEVIWYKDTIEEQVAKKVASKFSCLGEVVGRKESWVSLFDKLSEEAVKEDNEVESLLFDEPAKTNKDDEDFVDDAAFAAEALANEN